jgi:hypothetical protein
MSRPVQLHIVTFFYSYTFFYTNSNLQKMFID